MAKKVTAKEIPINQPMWWSSLAYMPTEYKESRLWMAQSLFYAKLNSQLFQDPIKAAIYRSTDRLEIDSAIYKELIDPSTPKETGGKAEYFSSDWKAIPIDVHLDNIIDATTRKTPLNITCSLADPVAKLQEQKDKEKILAQGMVRNIINWFAEEMGMPKISESVDPYKWIQNFTAKKGQQKVDTVGDVIDQIKTKIHDDDGLRLFQGYLYKNGLEVAFEIGIKYYMLDQNEFQVKYSQDFLRDIKHFNKASGTCEIDEMTGQLQIMYIDPTTLYTSPFRDKNGDDLLYYFFEKNVTFADFERFCGAELDDKQKQEVLTLQKQQGWTSGIPFGNNSNRNNSQLRLGFFGILTQEANAFSETYVGNNQKAMWDSKPLSWEPEANETKRVKVYNVWYKCCYIPLTMQEYNRNNIGDWGQQSKFIFNIKKDKDMMRYGVDRRYVKPSLVIYKNDAQASWTDIKEAFMPKMNNLWHKFQNCIVQDVQGLALDQDLLGGMLNAIDEGNKDDEGGGDAIINEWKMLRQAGMAWLKFRDKNGAMIIQDPSKLFVPIDSGHMKKAEMYLQMILGLYNLMTQALAKGGANEGLQPEARTPLGGIEVANQNANKATYFVEESYIEGVIIPFAYRFAHHIHTICKENKTFDFAERYKIFNDVIGSYNGAVIEGISDIQLSNVGLTIANKDDSSKKEIVIQQIVGKYAQKAISTAGLGLVLSTENYKLQLVELALEESKQNEIAQAAAAQQQQYQMQQLDKQLQIAQALQASKSQGVNSNLQTQGQIDAQITQLQSQLKEKNMELQKAQLLQNKLQENQQKADLKKDDSTHNANLEQQTSLAAT